MSILPPHDFYSTALATIYTIAHVAYIETNTKKAQNGSSYFYSGYDHVVGIYAEWVSEGKLTHAKLIVEDIRYDRHPEHPDNPFMPGGINVRLKIVGNNKLTIQKEMFSEMYMGDMRKKEINKKVFEIDEIFISLRPPYKDCLKFEKIRPTMMFCDDYYGFMSIDNATVYIPDVANLLANYTRQVLAEEKVDTYLLEENGDFTKIPPSFWRTEKSAKALMYEHPFSICVDGINRVGHVFTKVSDLCKQWDCAYSKYIDDVEGSVRKSDLINISRDNYERTPQDATQASIYINYMLEISSNLNLVNGRRADGGRIPIDEVERAIHEGWHEGLGPKSSARVQAMASLIRHPDDSRGGNIKGPALPQQITPSGKALTKKT